MPCYRPWRVPGGDGLPLPCGQCRGCRAQWSREWAMRCMHESSMHEDSIFLTLTYDDDHLPAKASLDREAFPVFIRALRKRLWLEEVRKAKLEDREPVRPKVRYFYVGEYGTINNRPHYHALLFGYRPGDAVPLAQRGDHPVSTSAELRDIWTAGLHEFGEVSPASALYCTGYMKRKMTGSWAKLKYGERTPEFCQMSRNPGIGAGWIDKYAGEVYATDGAVPVRGVLVKAPRYYDCRVERMDPISVESVRWKRYEKRVRENESPERLEAMEICASARQDINERRLL